jgi:hypothetical protein
VFGVKKWLMEPSNLQLKGGIVILIIQLSL